jgi:hypothetical protein
MSTKTKRPNQPPLLTKHNPGSNSALAAKAASECALLVAVAPGSVVDARLTITKEGPNVVVSWPATNANCVLESNTALTPGWTAVQTIRKTNEQWVNVTLPLNDGRRFFRLKNLAIADKDPNEKQDEGGKDPNEDKDPGEKTKDYETKEPNEDKDPTERRRSLKVLASDHEHEHQTTLPTASLDETSRGGQDHARFTLFIVIPVLNAGLARMVGCHRQWRWSRSSHRIGDVKAAALAAPSRSACRRCDSCSIDRLLGSKATCREEPCRVGFRGGVLLDDDHFQRMDRRALGRGSC